MSTEEIAKRIKEAPVIAGLPVKIVAVDGHGGSGKSTLALELAEKMGASIIQTDDFASWDNPYDWWAQLIEKALEPIKLGAKTLSYPRSSWWPDHRPEPVVDQPVTDVVILEGVSSARKEFRPYLSYAIWVETPLEICLQRGLERDGQDKREMWLKWQADEKEYVARDNPQTYANVVVKGVE